MSKFFQGGSSSSGSDSEVEVTKPTGKRPVNRRILLDDDDDDDEAKRTVKTAQEKATEAFKEISKQLQNHKKIRDVANVFEDFTSLCNAWQKNKNNLTQQYPTIVMKAIADLEDFVVMVWEDEKKRKEKDGKPGLNKANAVALTKLRKQLKKYVQDNSLEEVLEEQRHGGDNDDQEEDEVEEDDDFEEDYDDDDDDDFEKVKKPGLDADDDDDDWSMSSSESSSSDEEFAGITHLDFLKTEGADKTAKEKKRRDKGDERRVIKPDESDEDVMPFDQKPTLFKTEEEMTVENVYRKYQEVVKARGKKSTNRSQLIENLMEICTVIHNKNMPDGFFAKCLMDVIMSMFEHRQNLLLPMSAPKWTKALEYVEKLVALCRKAGNNLFIHASVVDSKEMPDDEMAETLMTAPYKVHGSLLHLLERMDDEFVKLLQSCDPHSAQYVARLRDESVICSVFDRIAEYMEAHSLLTVNDICPIYLRIMLHMYYKHNKILKIAGLPYEDTFDRMRKLYTYIYENDTSDDSTFRIEALLCYSYHLALHDRYYEARVPLVYVQDLITDRLGDSQMHQMSTTRSNPGARILYNRCLAQLGLAAFRAGLIDDTLNCLKAIYDCSYNRAKELLAQGYMKQNHLVKPAEKLKLLPFHQHINLDIVEAVYLVSALLIEFPLFLVDQSLGKHRLEPYDARNKVHISRTFHNLLRQPVNMKTQDQMPNYYPMPDTFKEHILTAAHAMRSGDWKLCYENLVNDRMNKLIWRHFPNGDEIRSTICENVKLECMRCYVVQYCDVFNSIEVQWLADSFELPVPKVRSKVCKMIATDELNASLDQGSLMVMINQVTVNPVHRQCLNTLREAHTLMEHNQRFGQIDRALQSDRGMDRGRQDRNMDRSGGGDRGGRQFRYDNRPYKRNDYNKSRDTRRPSHQMAGAP